MDTGYVKMDMICKKSCMDKIPYYKSTKVDDDEAFFDLIAKRFDVGAPDIIFDNFDGFVSLKEKAILILKCQNTLLS